MIICDLYSVDFIGCGTEWLVPTQPENPRVGSSNLPLGTIYPIVLIVYF